MEFGWEGEVGLTLGMPELGKCRRAGHGSEDLRNHAYGFFTGVLRSEITLGN